MKRRFALSPGMGLSTGKHVQSDGTETGFEKRELDSASGLRVCAGFAHMLNFEEGVPDSGGVTDLDNRRVFSPPDGMVYGGFAWVVAP